MLLFGEKRVINSYSSFVTIHSRHRRQTADDNNSKTLRNYRESIVVHPAILSVVVESCVLRRPCYKLSTADIDARSDDDANDMAVDIIAHMIQLMPLCFN